MSAGRPGVPTPPPGPGAALAVWRVPPDAGRAVAGFARVVVAVGLGFAAVCLLMGVGVLVAGETTFAVVTGVATVVWLLVAAAGWAYGRRTAGTPAATGGTVIGAVLPDAVDVGGGLVLPMGAVEEVGLFWFAVHVRGRAVGLGGAVADGLVGAANEAAGGNLGLAVVVRPRDPRVLQTPARPGTLPVRVRTDPVGRPVAVLAALRLVVDGDPVAFARALADVAARHRVPVGGAPTPPPDPPELAAWLR